MSPAPLHRGGMIASTFPGSAGLRQGMDNSPGLGVRVWGLGFRASGLGFWV